MYETAELQRLVRGEDFIPGLQDKIVIGSQGDTALQKFSAFVPADELILNQSIALKETEEISFW